MHPPHDHFLLSPFSFSLYICNLINLSASIGIVVNLKFKLICARQRDIKTRGEDRWIDWCSREKILCVWQIELEVKQGSGSRSISASFAIHIIDVICSTAEIYWFSIYHSSFLIIWQSESSSSKRKRKLTLKALASILIFEKETSFNANKIRGNAFSQQRAPICMFNDFHWIGWLMLCKW